MSRDDHPRRLGIPEEEPWSGSTAPVAPAQEAGAPRNAARLVMSRSFGLLFFAKCITTSAVWVHSTAAAILVYDLTGSSTAVAVVTIAQFAPQLVLAPVSGAWADRYDPTTQMIWGRLCCVVGAVLLAAWVHAFADDATVGRNVAAIAICSLVVGVGFVIGGPAMQAVVPSLLRSGEMTTAMALNTAPMTVARIIGPTAGAFVAVAAGPTAAFALTAVAHLTFIPLVWLAALPRRKGGAASPRSTVLEGLAYIRRHGRLWRGLVGAAAVGLGSEPVLTLSPALVSDLGVGPEGVGWLTTTFGVGAACALLYITTAGGWILPKHLSGVGLALLFGGLVGLTVFPQLWLCLLATAVMGVGFSLGLTGFSAILQEESLPAMRGRVMAMWLMAFVGSRPLAVGLSGSVADLVTVRAGYAVLAGAVLLMALVAGGVGGRGSSSARLPAR